MGGRDSRSRPISRANDRDGNGNWDVDGTRGSGSDASRRSRAVVLNSIVSYRIAMPRNACKMAEENSQSQSQQQEQQQ